MHIQAMKAKHDLQLVNTVKQLLEKQGDDVTKFVKQNEQIETQQILIETLSTKLDAVERKNFELAQKAENQNLVNASLNERMEKVEKRNIELDEKVELQIIVNANLNERLDGVVRRNEELFKAIESEKNKNDLKSKEKMKILEEESKKEIDNVVKLLNQIENTQRERMKKSNQHFENIENQLKDHQNKIEALILFSSDLSRLHLTLSHQYFRRNLQKYFTFHEGEYSNTVFSNLVRGEVNTWNDFTKEVTERDQKFNGCNFLQNLKKAINKYSISVYPKNQEHRYALCQSNQFDDLSFNNLKIQCLLHAHYISFKLCNPRSMFNNERGR